MLCAQRGLLGAVFVRGSGEDRAAHGRRSTFTNKYWGWKADLQTAEQLGISGMSFLEHMWENRLPTDIFRAREKRGNFSLRTTKAAFLLLQRKNTVIS